MSSNIYCLRTTVVFNVGLVNLQFLPAVGMYPINIGSEKVTAMLVVELGFSVYRTYMLRSTRWAIYYFYGKRDQLLGKILLSPVFYE